MYQEREDRIATYLSGNLPEKECALFLKALESNPSFKNDFLVYKQIWELTNQLSHSSDGIQSGWADLQKQLETPVKPLRLHWLKFAASISLLAVISVSMWFFGSTDVSFTTRKSVMEYRLVDNSTIQMHYNSTLSYAKDFNEENRSVTLEGAAYFDIAKSEKPFIIHTDNGEVTVYGTQFTVFSHDELFTVELHEGSVSILFDGISHKLEPGERFFSDNTTLFVSSFKQASSWSDNLELNNVPLSYIISQLKLTYGLSSDLDGKWLRESYTLSLPKNDLTACLTILNDVVGKNIAVKNQTIVLN
jgi:ferric-dicitrate binding protein FerR (iron transport regulator)